MRARAVTLGLVAGVAAGAVTGLADCIRSSVEGGTVVMPHHWLGITAIYAALFAGPGLLAGLLGGLLFRRRLDAVFLLVSVGALAGAAGAYVNVVHLPAFKAPESLRFDAMLAGGAAAAFLLLYFLGPPAPARLRGWIVLLVLALGIAAAAPLLESGEDGTPLTVETGDGPRPNVLVVLADTLRADHLGAYGYERDTSPNLDALARECVLFTDCRVASTWTKPSTAAILTGLLPTAHGAILHSQVLPEAAATLAEVFAAAGYRTAAWSDNPFISPEFGFAQGFEDFDSVSPSPFVNGTLAGKVLWTLGLVNLTGELGEETVTRGRGTAELGERFLEWAGDDPEDEPWFAYLHVMEPHTPYDPPAPFRGRFSAESYAGPDLTEPPDYGGFLPFEKGPAVPPDQLRHLVARYDEEILCFDAGFGAIVAGLRERGLLDRTILVVLSDHGEEFYEHEGWTHGHSLHDELLRVPLVVHVPGAAPKRVTTPVRALDLFPTLLALAGIRADLPALGADLSPAIAGDGAVPDAPTISEVRFGGAEAVSIVTKGRKLIRARQGERSVDLAYDLAKDPAERSPLDSPSWLGAFAAKLEDVLRAAESLSLEAEERQLTPEELDRLRGLGYFR